MIEPAEQIKTALKNGKLTGSWLICGPYGVGKKEFVTRLCAYLTTGNWEADLSFHPDIKWIERSLTEEEKKETVKSILAGKTVEDNAQRARKKEITVDDIREGLKFLSLKSSAAHLRILVINLADDMNENAANALLKMLEEPNDNTLILLICQNMGKLLPTIRSRCRKIMMRAKSEAQLVAQIKNQMPYCKDPELLASLSEGSIGLAQDIYANKGIELYQKMLSFMVPWAQLDIEKLGAFADSFIKDEMAYNLLRVFMSSWISARAKEKCRASDLATEEWLDLFDEITRSFNEVNYLYTDKKQTIMNAFFKISQRLQND